MSRFKIIVFLLAVAITASIGATAWWFYTRVMGKATRIEAQIQDLQGSKGVLPDPGVKRFERAAEQIAASDLDGGRAALYELVRTFPDSARVSEAKRIIGEMNMDMLFSQDVNPLKKDYIVQPGDSLNLIARKNQTTVECVLRANGLESGMLQPGDHLFVFPLDFEIVVDMSAKTVSLLRNQRFFKEYRALDIKLPTGLKIPLETKISDKAAWVRGKRVNPLSAEFTTADKWLMGEKNGLNFRVQPQARPVPPPSAAPASLPAATKGGKKGKTSRNSGATMAGTSVDDADDLDATANMPATGVFLPREDTEELFTIIRTQTPVKVVR